MIRKFLDKSRLNAAGAIVHRLVILCWAVSCGSHVYHGDWLEGFTYFVGGLLLLSVTNELEDSRAYFDAMEDGNKVFVKAEDKGNDGVLVIAAGTLEDVVRCATATSKFTAKALAESDENEDTAIECFKEVLITSLDAYCEDKGIDKDAFFKRMGINRVD